MAIIVEKQRQARSAVRQEKRHTAAEESRLLLEELPDDIKRMVFLSPQKPCALMSTLASSCLFAVCSTRVSPERGCSSGSIPMLGHTSVSSFAERSLISLCLRKLNPP